MAELKTIELPRSLARKLASIERACGVLGWQLSGEVDAVSRRIAIDAVLNMQRLEAAASARLTEHFESRPVCAGSGVKRGQWSKPGCPVCGQRVVTVDGVFTRHADMRGAR